jgi:hypothetical protein
MQVSYKTVTSLEFDILTGSYKQVEKQVEDTSGGFADNAFYELLMGLNGGDSSANAYEMGDESAFKLNEGLGAKGEQVQNAELMGQNSLNESLYALRFREDEGDLLRAKEAFSMPNGEQIKGDLMSELLSALG